MKERLPESYLLEMKKLLENRSDYRYEDYIKSLQDPVHSGLRTNTLKISPEDLKEKLPFTLDSIPWIRDGFFCREEERPARSPWYQAGLYYLQEPSAMTPADRLPVNKGEKVLDLCAAPGGKATRLACSLEQTGMLYANDISSSRAKALLKNLELFGAANICVMSESPAKLASCYPRYFDKILIDAPCSGEGMFHRDPRMVQDWVKRGPDYYCAIQKELLQQGYEMLRPGGMMLYSTCTFSSKENEENIDWILKQHPQLSLEEIRPYEGFSPGQPPLLSCVRIFPGKMPAEGHFLALLKKSPSADGCPPAANPGRKETLLPRDAKEFLEQISWETRFHWQQIGEQIYGFPENFLPQKQIRYLRTGLLAGTMKKDRFEPSQALAMYLKGDSFPRTVNLSSKDPRILRYLKGETLDLSDLHPESGWNLVCLETYPLGWGKVQGAVLKNKFYSGWRWQ